MATSSPAATVAAALTLLEQLDLDRADFALIALACLDQAGLTGRQLDLLEAQLLANITTTDTTDTTEED